MENILYFLLPAQIKKQLLNFWLKMELIYTYRIRMETPFWYGKTKRKKEMNFKERKNEWIFKKEL